METIINIISKEEVLNLLNRTNSLDLLMKVNTSPKQYTFIYNDNKSFKCTNNYLRTLRELISEGTTKINDVSIIDNFNYRKHINKQNL